MSANRSFTRRQFLKSGVSGPSEMMRQAGQSVVKTLPKDWGFALIAFPLDSRDGEPRYVSNGDRESVLKLLRDFVAKQDQKPPTISPETN